MYEDDYMCEDGIACVKVSRCVVCSNSCVKLVCSVCVVCVLCVNVEINISVCGDGNVCVKKIVYAMS